MNRLTKDLNTPHDDTTYSDALKDVVDRENIVLTKLKHYEDLEEQLGCPLDVAIKVQRQGYFYDINGVKLGNEKDIILIDFNLGRIHLAIDCNMYNVFTVYMSDYQKTWWLKQDKTE